MQIDFLTVFVAVLSLVVLAVPGYLLQKCKLLPEKAGEAFSTLVLYGAQPLLVFMSFQKDYTPEIAINILIVAVVAIVVHFIMFGLVALIVRNKNNEEKKKVVRYACCFSNCGYMGLPFLQMLLKDTAYGDEVIIYAAMVIAIFNMLNWTVGVFMITQDKKEMSFKKVILNPTIIAVIIGALYFFIVQKPIVSLAATGTQLSSALDKIMGSLDSFGNMVTPLAMVVIGMRLANVNLKQLFLDKWAYFVCFMKLIIMSLVTMIVVSFLPISPVVKYAAFFLFSMPSATSTTLFAVKYNSDGDSASVFTLLTTVTSIVTIPLMFLLFSGVFGVVIV